MTNDTKLSWRITGMLVVPAVIFITGVLWYTATSFDHTEAKSISMFAALEGSTTFAVVRWCISRQTFRESLKRSIHHIWELL